jgi:DNA recombination-dependent growth factor C
MDAKLFKTFTPIVNLGTSRTAVQHVFDKLDDREAFDPVGSQWRGIGFIRPIEGDDFLIEIDGAGWLACVQINERNLPGAVIREKVLEKALAQEQTTGRKAGKKELAQIRDDVELELLPKAFIRRKLVPVMLIGKKVFVFTSSAKIIDDVLALLSSVADMQDMFDPAPLSMLVERNIDAELTIIAREGKTADFTPGDGDEFDASDLNFLQTNNACVLKGPNKKTITIKDKDLGSKDLYELLQQEYVVTKLGLDHVQAGSTEPDCSFILSDKLVFSRFAIVNEMKVRGKSKEDADATFIGTAWLVAKAVDQAVDTVISVMGGLRATAKPVNEQQVALSKEAFKADSLDDDEL